MSKSNRSKPSAGKLISGTHGVIWINGSKCYEVSKFEAKLSADREEVQFAGEMVKDSKLMALSGTWSATIKKIYSYAKTIAEKFMHGEDVRVTLIGKLEDPDNGGIEKIQLSNCWFDEVTLQSFEGGKICEDELSGGFTDVSYLNDIADPCD